MLRAALIALVLTPVASAFGSSTDVIGQASVIDGDTLEIQGTRIPSERAEGPTVNNNRIKSALISISLLKRQALL